MPSSTSSGATMTNTSCAYFFLVSSVFSMLTTLLTSRLPRAAIKPFEFGTSAPKLASPSCPATPAPSNPSPSTLMTLVRSYFLLLSSPTRLTSSLNRHAFYRFTRRLDPGVGPKGAGEVQERGRLRRDGSCDGEPDQECAWCEGEGRRERGTSFLPTVLSLVPTTLMTLTTTNSAPQLAALPR
jgi:hypothetical protein